MLSSDRIVDEQQRPVCSQQKEGPALPTAMDEPASHSYVPPQSHFSSENDYDHRHQSMDPYSARQRNQSTSQLDQSTVRRDSTIFPERTRIRPQPINEAVGSAVASTDVSPDLIAQITENVLKQLKTTGIESSATPIPLPQTKFPPPPVQQPVPQSPSTLSGSSPPMHTRVYTPPSPHKQFEYPSHGSPHSQSGVLPGVVQSPQEPRSPIKEAPNIHFSDRRPSSPLSQSSESSHTRPKGPIRLSTGKEETTLEKIWGQLFDEECHPTPRLGQFLRGLAVHIVS